MATFQVSSAKWSIASALPFAACSSQLTRTRSGEILALGGRACSDSSPMRDVARWNPVTHTWTKVPPMNVAKMPRTFELGDTLYAYDGAYVERRSATTGYWQMLPPSFAVGVGAAAPLDDTHVLALSEPHGSSWGSWAIHLTRACVYDVAKNAWESAPTLPMWLASADAVPIAPGRVLFVGGIGGSYNNNSEPPVVSPSYGSETWSGIPSLGARFGQSTTQLADGRIVVAGGQYGCHPSCVGALASTYVIDP